jgi:ribosomal protein S18 acetylase RimI-like enzyme
MVAGVPAGFLTVIDSEQNGRRTRAIDLNAVDTAYRRRGVGLALTGYFVREYRDQFDRLVVGTQAANIPSLRLYERCGFTVDHTSYVLHLHAAAGRPQ